MNRKIKDFLKAEFVTGQSLFDWCFLAFGILLQVFAVVYGYVTGTPDNVASIISALTGIISVVLCAQGKISFYAFGFVQLLTYVFGVVVPNKLYGELWENVFYFVTMVVGVVIWIKHYKIGDKQTGAKIDGKRLSLLGNIIYYGTMIVGSIVLSFILKKTDDPVPVFDAITTVPAFAAEILMVLGYREQWSGWVVEDIASIIMFSMLGNWVMVAQYVFWTINCVYGWICWSKNSTGLANRGVTYE